MKIYKILAFILSVFYLALPLGALAANTHSLSLSKTSSQYAYAIDSTSLSITDKITLEFWYKPTSIPDGGTEQDYFTKVDSGQESYFLGSDGATNVLSFVGYNLPSYEIYKTSGSFFAAGDVGNWIHVAAAVDSSGSTAVMCKNGVSQSMAAKSGTATSIKDGSSNLFVGALGNDGSPIRFADGLIDDVRIYNIARSCADIAGDYQQELTGSETGLVAYWKLNNSAVDSTSNGNDLTLVNTPTYSTDVPNWGGGGGAVILSKPILFFE